MPSVQAAYSEGRPGAVRLGSDEGRIAVPPRARCRGRRAVPTVGGMMTTRDGQASRTGAPAVRLEAVSRIYGKGAGAVHALRGVSITLPYGSFTAVMGPSGSGKSTLLQTAAGLDRPTTGRAWIGPVDLSKLNQARLTELRRDRIGFVFQAFNLLPSLTVEQNVTLPLRLAGRRADRRLVTEVLGRVGLTDRRRHRPAASSSGSPWRGRSSPGPRFCSPTSPPARWTCAPASRCSGCSASWSTRWHRRW